MVGKKKSLSTFTHIWEGGPLAGGEGIKTEGGILFSLEGKLMASSFQDIMSAPDESGRRWLSSGNFEGMFGLGNFDIEGHLDKNKTWKEKYSGLSMDLDTLFNEEKAEYIKIYIDEVTKLMVKNKVKIKKAFGQKITKSPYGKRRYNSSGPCNSLTKSGFVFNLASTPTTLIPNSEHSLAVSLPIPPKPTIRTVD